MNMQAQTVRTLGSRRLIALRCALFAAVAGPMALSAPAASALDQKVIAGAECKPTYASQLDVRYRPRGLAYSNASVVNVSLESDGGPNVIRVVCPLPRDNKSSAWHRIHVRVTHNSSAVPLTCTATAYDPWGRNPQSVTVRSNPPRATNVELQLHAPSVANASGAFELVCGLPGNTSRNGKLSAIHSIRLIEHDE